MIIVLKSILFFHVFWFCLNKHLKYFFSCQLKPRLKPNPCSIESVSIDTLIKFYVMYILSKSSQYGMLYWAKYWQKIGVINSRKGNLWPPLKINRYSQLTRCCSGNASALGARGPGFNPRLRPGFLCLIFCFGVVEFLLFCQKHIICHKSLQFPLQFRFFSILKILPDLWPIIRV